MNTASHRCFRVVLITLFGALCVVTALVCVGIGTSHFSLREIVRGLFVADDSTSRLLIWHLRFPRILCGGLVGVCLSLSGCILQGVMRNTMASPSTIGVTGGASFIGYITLVVFPNFSHLLPIGSIVGAFVTTIGWLTTFIPLRMSIWWRTRAVSTRSSAWRAAHSAP